MYNLQIVPKEFFNKTKADAQCVLVDPAEDAPYFVHLPTIISARCKFGVMTLPSVYSSTYSESKNTDTNVMVLPNIVVHRTTAGSANGEFELLFMNQPITTPFKVSFSDAPLSDSAQVCTNTNTNIC